jgi:hypothetical protein
VIALAAAWELVARPGAVMPFMLPALSAVIERIWHDLVAGDLSINTAVTLYRALAGFLIGAVAGIALGVAVSRNGLAHWFFDAFLPVVILWLGVYDLSKISMVAWRRSFPWSPRPSSEPAASSASCSGRRATSFEPCLRLCVLAVVSPQKNKYSAGNKPVERPIKELARASEGPRSRWRL